MAAFLATTDHVQVLGKLHDYYCILISFNLLQQPLIQVVTLMLFSPKRLVCQDSVECARAQQYFIKLYVHCQRTT